MWIPTWAVVAVVLVALFFFEDHIRSAIQMTFVVLAVPCVPLAVLSLLAIPVVAMFSGAEMAKLAALTFAASGSVAALGIWTFVRVSNAPTAEGTPSPPTQPL